MFAEPLQTRQEVIEQFLVSYGEKYALDSKRLPTVRYMFPLGDDIPMYRRFLTDKQLQRLFEDLIHEMVIFALNSLREGTLVAAKPTMGEGLAWLDRPTATQAFSPIRRVRVRTKYCCDELSAILYINAPLEYVINLFARLGRAGYRPVREEWHNGWSIRIM